MHAWREGQWDETEPTSSPLSCAWLKITKTNKLKEHSIFWLHQCYLFCLKQFGRRKPTSKNHIFTEMRLNGNQASHTHTHTHTPSISHTPTLQASLTHTLRQKQQQQEQQWYVKPVHFCQSLAPTPKLKLPHTKTSSSFLI
jgi:hypothetical protein